MDNELQEILNAQDAHEMLMLIKCHGEAMGGFKEPSTLLVVKLLELMIEAEQ